WWPGRCRVLRAGNDVGDERHQEQQRDPSGHDEEDAVENPGDDAEEPADRRGGAVVLRVHEVFDTLADAHAFAFRSRTSRTSGISAAIVARTVSPCLTSMAVSLSATMVCSGYQTLPASRMARLTSPFRFDPVTVSTQTASRPCG